MYQVDPNDSKKQVPKTTHVNTYARSENPPIEENQSRPNYILINVNGTYAFAYESGSAPGTYITGSHLGNAAGGPVRLDIQPIAWRQTDTPGTVGDVTFVYRGRGG
tara:strand:+ start:436 stop:753 length:318 start_codon:yes stop_codon:yes gene_type:complete